MSGRKMDRTTVFLHTAANQLVPKPWELFRNLYHLGWFIALSRAQVHVFLPVEVESSLKKILFGVDVHKICYTVYAKSKYTNDSNISLFQ